MTDEITDNRYDFRAVEQKWQTRWDEADLFRIENTSDKTQDFALPSSK